MEKHISIIIPCYNVERYIDRCIRSLVNQTIGIGNLELIFVDDASQDGTWEKLLRWERRYPENILLLRNAINLRQGGARNKGLEYASAPYIGFVDSDDWVEETMFEKMHNKAKEYGCDMVSVFHKQVFNERTKLGRRSGSDRYLKISSVKERKALMEQRILGNMVYTKIYKRELVDSHGIRFPEGLFYEDNYWSPLILLYVKDIYMIYEELYHYYVNYESTSLKRNDARKIERLDIELMKLEEYRKRGVYDTYRDEIEFKFLILYFINTCHTIITTWDEFHIDLYKKMKDQVNELFPNYRDNEYIKGLSEFMRMILDSMEYVDSQEELDEWKERYLKRIAEC